MRKNNLNNKNPIGYQLEILIHMPLDMIQETSLDEVLTENCIHSLNESTGV